MGLEVVGNRENTSLAHAMFCLNSTGFHVRVMTSAYVTDKLYVGRCFAKAGCLAGGGTLGSKYYKEILHSFSHKLTCVSSMLTRLSHKKFTHIVSTAVWDFWRGFPS